MAEPDWLTQQFEENRGHLRGVAFRILGSLSEAEDAVQDAWLKLSRSDTSGVDNLGGWLTTVVARVCLDMHARGARKSGETDLRSFTVAGWRDAPYFSDEERAALALTEAVTRLSDRADPVPDDVWNEAARHFNEQALAAIVLQISLVNVWNRLNVTTRQVAGEWVAGAVSR